VYKLFVCLFVYCVNSSNTGLELSDFEEMLKHLSPIRYPAGAYVFREGDQPDGLYFITSGKVRQ
jgi:CRP-like cAMP-binding protein